MVQSVPIVSALTGVEKMSGGYFDYWQYHIARIADDVDTLIRNNDNNELNEWGDTRGSHYSVEVIEKFKEALICLRQAEIYAQRIDWLVSADDDEDSFLERLQEELSALNKLQSGDVE